MGGFVDGYTAVGVCVYGWGVGWGMGVLSDSLKYLAMRPGWLRVTTVKRKGRFTECWSGGRKARLQSEKSSRALGAIREGTLMVV